MASTIAAKQTYPESELAIHSITEPKTILPILETWDKIAVSLFATQAQQSEVASSVARRFFSAHSISQMIIEFISNDNDSSSTAKYLGCFDKAIQLQGCIVVLHTKSKYFEHALEIKYLLTNPENTHHGIGTLLEHEVQKIGHEERADAIVLKPLSSAKDFYAKLGYRPEGARSPFIFKILT